MLWSKGNMNLACVSIPEEVSSETRWRKVMLNMLDVLLPYTVKFCADKSVASTTGQFYSYSRNKEQIMKLLIVPTGNHQNVSVF